MPVMLSNLFWVDHYDRLPFWLMKTFCITLFSIFLFAAMASTAIRAQLLPGIYSNCDFCMCSMGISPLAMGGSSIRLDTRYTELGREYSNGVKIPNTTNQKETYLTNVLSLQAELTDGLSTTLMVPFCHKSESEVDPGSGLASASNSGIGDLSLLMRYNIIADHEWANQRLVAVTAGVKFANGSTSLQDNGHPADPDVQLGTGTTDFYAGVGGLLGFGNWNIEVNALALIRGFGNGSSGHTYGDNLNYDVLAKYRFYENLDFMPTLFSPMVFGSIGIRGEWRGYEEQNGVPLHNDELGWSGGNVVYVSPGIQFFFAPRVSLDASVWLPVVHALYGQQLGETVKAMAGIQMGI